MLHVGSEPELDLKRFDPRNLILGFSLVIFGAVFFGIVIPAATAYYSDVFFLDRLRSKIEKQDRDVADSLKKFENRQADIRQHIKNIETKIDNIDEPEGTISSLVRQKGEYEKALKEEPAISLQPYYEHIVSYFWPIAFLCFGIVAFLIQPEERLRRRLDISSTIATAVIVASALVAPLWLRTMFATSIAHGRTVYAFTNPDISISSFVVQNLNFFILALLLTIIWRQSTAVALLCREQVQHCHATNKDKVDVSLTLLQRSASLLVRWQIVLLLISLPFFVYEAIFWTQIIGHGDLRFVFEAVVVQLIWILTIAITGLPLFITCRGWYSYKEKVVAHFLNRDWSGENKYQEKLSIIRELSPFGSWNALATGITVVSSLFLPIIQAFIKSRSG